MKLFCKILFVFVLMVLAVAGKTQLTKPFTSTEVADNYTMTLQGDKNATETFRWTNASTNFPSTIVRYTFQVDTVGGDFNNPLIIIGSACCSGFFSDTVMNVTREYLANELAFVLKDRYNKTFRQGESVTLQWIIKANATGPGPTFENRSTQVKTITFARGQFDQEYTPVVLAAPLDNSSFFVEDNDAIKITFSWKKAYCPSGCAAPQYQLFFDSLGGDFSNPLYYYTIPQSPFDTIFDLRQDILAALLYNDGVPRNTPKTYKWTVKVTGNSEEFFATQPNRISLLRGLMKTENQPYFLKTPVDNGLYKLEKNKNDSIIFSWNRTYTGYPDQASYTILFDTAKATPNFNNPKFRFSTGLGDTTFDARYLALRDSLDKWYGTRWVNIKLRWTVQADVIGDKFMSNDTFDLLFARGFFTGIAPLPEQQLNIYPNPATDALYILAGDTEQELKVFDAAGREVHCRPENNNGIIHINISELPGGVYYIQLNSAAALRSGVFIKQ